MKDIDCSVILPLLNESENIEYAYKVLTKVLTESGKTYEIIFVDDGSTDDSMAKINDLIKKDFKVKAISFSKNFGQQSAILAGLKNCNGKCAVHMDIDMQEPPETILEMLKLWEEGYQVVTVKRNKRKEGLVKRFFAKCYYKLLKMISGNSSSENMAEFRLFDRLAINEIINLPEKNRFLKFQTAFIGFKQKTIKVNRVQRVNGKTKYNFKKLFNTAITGIVSTSNKPLYYAFSISLVTHFLSFCTLLTLIILLILKIAFDVSLWLIPVILTTGGFIMLILAIIGIYLSFMFDEIKDRPSYIIKEKINFED